MRDYANACAANGYHIALIYHTGREPLGDQGEPENETDCKKGYAIYVKNDALYRGHMTVKWIEMVSESICWWDFDFFAALGIYWQIESEIANVNATSSQLQWD